MVSYFNKYLHVLDQFEILEYFSVSKVLCNKWQKSYFKLWLDFLSKTRFYLNNKHRILLHHFSTLCTRNTYFAHWKTTSCIHLELSTVSNKFSFRIANCVWGYFWLRFFKHIKAKDTKLNALTIEVREIRRYKLELTFCWITFSLLSRE